MRYKKVIRLVTDEQAIIADSQIDGAPPKEKGHLVDRSTLNIALYDIADECCACVTLDAAQDRHGQFSETDVSCMSQSGPRCEALPVNRKRPGTPI